MGEIDLGLVNWSRAQFALTAMYHWIFVPLTLGLSFLCAFFESIYVKTGKRGVAGSDTLLDDAFWHQLCDWCSNRHYS